MPYCNNCGAQLPAEAKFCQNCGVKVGHVISQQPIIPPVSTKEAALAKNRQKIKLFQRIKTKSAEPKKVVKWKKPLQFFVIIAVVCFLISNLGTNALKDRFYREHTPYSYDNMTIYVPKDMEVEIQTQPNEEKDLVVLSKEGIRIQIFPIYQSLFTDEEFLEIKYNSTTEVYGEAGSLISLEKVHSDSFSEAAYKGVNCITGSEKHKNYECWLYYYSGDYLWRVIIEYWDTHDNTITNQDYWKDIADHISFK